MTRDDPKPKSVGLRSEEICVITTTNFVHGFPFVCISLGFLYNKKPTVRVIYNPFLDQMF